jgi:PAS domain S-box-containing protein
VNDESPELGRARLDDVLESVSEAFYALDTDWRFVVFNRAAEEFFGMERAKVLGESLWTFFPQAEDNRFARACRAAMSEGAVDRFEAPSFLRTGRVVELRVGPLNGGGVTVVLTDITERIEAQRRLEAAAAALRESEEDLRHAAELNPQVQWRALPSGELDRVTQRWRDWTGTAPADLAQVVHPEDAEASFAAWRHSRTTGEPVDMVHRVRFRSGEYRWLRTRAFARRDEAGAIVRWYGTTEDIHDQKLAEEHLNLLVLELNHRVKNNLATVQAIAMQTLRGARDLDEARLAFLDRIAALATAHDVLKRDRWEGVSIAETAKAVLAAIPEGADRIRLDGGDVRLPPQVAMSLSMAFHELGTNALKYGALSTPEGRVTVGWTLEGAGPTLRLTWAETGGPPVSPPTSRGFGSRLLERGLANELQGEVKMIFDPAGLRCEIVAPVRSS